MAKHKVLFFDSWKGGSHNFVRLVDSFEKANIETLLVHLGSWGNEVIYEKEEEINGLKVRDISYYPSRDLRDLLRVEKPDLVLFLSTHTFAHRAIIRYCNSMKIPTVNLYHGFVRVQDVENKEGAYKVSKVAYSLFVLKRLPKLLTHTLPSYIKALARTHASKEDWGYFKRNIIETVTKPGSTRTAPDAKTTACMVYAQADVEHAVKTYNFEIEDVYIVGNPDLSVFNLTPALIAYGLEKNVSTFAIQQSHN